MSINAKKTSGFEADIHVCGIMVGDFAILRDKRLMTWLRKSRYLHGLVGLLNSSLRVLTATDTYSCIDNVAY